MTPTPEELDVKRFTHDCQPSKLRPLGESPDGGWVRYGDYAALRLSLEAARGEKEILQGHIREMAASLGRVMDERDVARGEIARLQSERQLDANYYRDMKAERDAAHAKLAGVEKDVLRMRKTLRWLRGETARESIHKRIDAALVEGGAGE